MFRFFSCSFRVGLSKEKTARVVMFREFGITNCYTIESSFHGFFDSERVTHDFSVENYLNMGKILL
jgi:hypothetical protein